MASYNKLEAEKSAIQSEYETYRQVYRENLTGEERRSVVAPENTFGSNPFSVGGKDDKEFYVWKRYKLTYKTKPKGFDHWVIIDGTENGEIQSDYIYCRGVGNVTIGAADKNGNLLDDFARTIKIER